MTTAEITEFLKGVKSGDKLTLTYERTLRPDTFTVREIRPWGSSPAVVDFYETPVSLDFKGGLDEPTWRYLGFKVIEVRVSA